MNLDEILEGVSNVIEEAPRIVFVDYPHVFVTVYWVLLLVWP